MTENNEMTLKKKQRNKRKTRKIALLFFLTGLTAILLIVETYAWFVGTTTIKANSFEIGVSSGDAFDMSLDGSTWKQELTITREQVLALEGATGDKAYTGHTNVWPDDNVGLIPLSTSGVADPAAGGRLKLYGKSSLTATGGGFRLISTRIDNHTSSGSGGTLVSEGQGYVAFDLFIRNGTGVDYISTYNRADDEAVYLTTDSKVEVQKAGDVTDDYGLANSVRMAFVQIGRIASAGYTDGNAKSITCFADGGSAEHPGVTSLCNQEDNVTIWEPNDMAHHKDLVTYFNRVCKKKTAAVGEGTGFTYSEACTALSESADFGTYVVTEDITSSDNVDVYDGLNGYEGSTKLSNIATFTDTMKIKTGADRPAFFYLAPNSITKVRIYIYLEGQDVDNYDLASNGKKIKVNFGFTKDQWDLANGVPAAPTD